MPRKRGRPPQPVPRIGSAGLAVGALCVAPMVRLDGLLPELAASWRTRIALALSISAAMALAVRARLLAWLFVALGADAIRTTLMSAQAITRSDHGNGDGAVRVVSSNISIRNGDTGTFAAWIKVSDPDVVVATEVSACRAVGRAHPVAPRVPVHARRGRRRDRVRMGGGVQLSGIRLRGVRATQRRKTRTARVPRGSEAS